MTQIETDLRNTKNEAKRLRFESVLPNIPATNVQDAIAQILAFAVVTPTSVTVAMSPYAVQPSDRILLVNTSAGAVTINMMAGAARNGLDLEVKDDTGNAVANPISVVRAGADLIDGLTTYPIDSAFAAVKFLPKAAGYDVV